MELKQIVVGHVNEALNRQGSLAENRMKICKQCPLYKETSLGPICNNRLYINIEDKVSVSIYPKVGYKRGCACRLSAKTRAPKAKCIVNK